MKIIVACSGGPDSMALLDMLQKQKKDIVVAHVNYQKRDTALRDENIVKEYCQKYNIPIHVLKPIKKTDENFQAWARDVRYQFFEDICDQYDTKEIYVAHQKDDRIETYLMQKRRNMICTTYGLKDHMIRNGYEIIRPLLNYTKNDLADYCHENNVSYGIDESNLTDHYTRNKIRHSIIEKMTPEEKDALCDKIDQENKEQEEYLIHMRSYFKEWDLDDLLSKEDNWRYLDYYLSSVMKFHLSKGYLQDLCIKLKKDICMEIDGYDVERFHGKLSCTPVKEKVHVVYDRLMFGEYPDYILCQQGRTIEGMTLDESDFPICIRTVENSDEIHLRFGSKNVHRFFVDRKIPKHVRKYWLVVENKDKNIIFVPEIGCDVKHFSVNPNLFMIEYNLIQ